MAPHSSTLAWKIPWTEEPGGLQSMGSHRVGHDWSNVAAAAVLNQFAILSCRRIDAFELWCWRKLLRIPWTARRSNQSILKEISPEYSLEGLMLKLKLQYFGHLMRRTDSFVKTLMLGKIEGRRKRGRQRMKHHWLNGHEFEQTPEDSEGQGILVYCSPWDHKESDMAKQLNWAVA